MKSALNLVLTLPDDGECPAILISRGIIDLGAFCVELWMNEGSYRMLVQMSYGIFTFVVGIKITRTYFFLTFMKILNYLLSKSKVPKM